MKKLFFLIFIFPLIIFSQCPDRKANEQKQKVAQYGEVSYTTLAVYYYYENGIANKTAEHIRKL